MCVAVRRRASMYGTVLRHRTLQMLSYMLLAAVVRGHNCTMQRIMLHKSSLICAVSYRSTLTYNDAMCVNAAMDWCGSNFMIRTPMLIEMMQAWAQHCGARHPFHCRRHRLEEGVCWVFKEQIKQCMCCKARWRTVADWPYICRHFEWLSRR